ncbi:MAG TPA: FAD-dependent oxidoreductase [Candidatus Krumholzibacteria bacterium]
MSADVCVIGLGGSGLACIDRLLRDGVSVVGVDAGTVGGAAAGRNGGLLRAGTSLFYHEASAKYGADRAARMYSATVAERERLLSRYPSIARRTGYLRLAHDGEDERDCRAHLAALRDASFPAQWYDGPLGRGMLVVEDAVIDPLARCRLEAGRVSSAGARLFENSPAVSLTTGAVETTGGVIRCRLTIVAVDGALASILPELAGRVWPMRLQMLASSPHAPGRLPHALSTRWGWDYSQQLPDGTIAFGGCRDVGGADERTSDATVTERVQSALERRFAEVIGSPPSVTHRWAATAGYTEDGLPVLGQVRPGVWATGGYSGTGNLFGAACGRAVVRLALGVATDSLLD